MDLGIRGRKAIVCASSKGLGKACAEFLAADGVDLVLVARGAEALETTAAEIRAKHKVNVTAVATDITTPAGREAALKAPARDIERLRDLIARNESAIADRNWTEALELNQTFHFALADIGNMVVLRGILNRLWLQMGPLIAESYHEGGRAMIDNRLAVRLSGT